MSMPAPTTPEISKPSRAPVASLAVVTALFAFALATSANAADAQDPGAAGDVRSEEVSDYGLGFRGGLVLVPQGFYEAFVERASSRTQQAGFGVDLVRRRGDFEVAFGVGYDQLSPDDGLWLEDGDAPPEDPPYLMEFDDLAWLTVGPAFTWHTPLGDSEQVALRYGAGVGLAIMLGDAYRTSTVCGGESPDLEEDCRPIEEGEDGRYQEPASIPAVLPLASATLGLQFRLHPGLNLNLEAGLRTTIYAGANFTVFF